MNAIAAADRPVTTTRIRRPFLGPAPRSTPPFDDELPLATGTTGWIPVPVAARRPDGPAVVTADHVPGWSNETDVGVCRTAAVDLPPVQRFAQQLATAAVEVLAGIRQVEQLRPHCAPDVFAGIQQRRRAPGRTIPRVIALRICEPADGVAEVAAVVRTGHRVMALAFRLQGLDRRWRMTSLQLD